jgi:hypothetical protein
MQSDKRSGLPFGTTFPAVLPETFFNRRSTLATGSTRAHETPELRLVQQRDPVALFVPASVSLSIVFTSCVFASVAWLATNGVTWMRLFPVP